MSLSSLIILAVSHHMHYVQYSTPHLKSIRPSDCSATTRLLWRSTCRLRDLHHTTGYARPLPNSPPQPPTSLHFLAGILSWKYSCS